MRSHQCKNDFSCLVLLLKKRQTIDRQTDRSWWNWWDQRNWTCHIDLMSLSLHKYTMSSVERWTLLVQRPHVHAVQTDCSGRRLSCLPFLAWQSQLKLHFPKTGTNTFLLSEQRAPSSLPFVSYQNLSEKFKQISLESCCSYIKFLHHRKTVRNWNFKIQQQLSLSFSNYVIYQSW